MFFTQLFVGVELAPRLRDLSAIIERWTPDVIVHEVAEPAAPIAATAAGLPYVTSGYGPLLSPAIAAQVGRAAAPHWRAAGLAPHPRGGSTSISTSTPARRRCNWPRSTTCRRSRCA